MRIPGKPYRSPFRRRALVTLLCWCFSAFSGFAQDDGFSDSLFRSFSEYSRHHLPEKCFVHISRNEYLAGDIMWFKVYSVDGWNNKPLSLSKVVYVELLDDENNPVLQAKLNLGTGDANGSFDIPDTLSSGWYRLRAYTNWMKNSGPEYFFEKPLRIFNPAGFAPAGHYPDARLLPVPDSFSNTGYGLSLNTSVPETMSVTVSSPSGAGDEGKPIWMFAQSHGLPKKVMQGVVKNGHVSFEIPVADLGEGVQQITIFAEAQKPVCERLFFIPPHREMKISLRSSKPEFQPRDPITLSVFTGDASGKPLVTDLSVSVYRMDSLSAPDTLSIDNYCWLGSELPGAVRSKGDFLQLDQAARTATDSLMQHNQWSRFSWQDVFSGRKPVFAPETGTHVITGKIISVSTGKPAPLHYAYASVVGKDALFRAAESDSGGIVRFEIPGFSGSNSLIVQTSQEDSAYRVELISPFSDRFTPLPSSVAKTGTAAAPGLGPRLFNSQIENIFQVDSQQQWLPVPPAAPLFYGRADYRYHLDDYKRFTTMEEVMREYIKTVNVYRSEGVVKLVMMNDPAKHFLTDAPLVLIDGVPDFDPGRPMNLDPLKIRDIELINHEYLLGPRKYAGIINCITYNGDLAGYSLPSKATTVSYEGMQPERKFFSPEYPFDKARNSRVPDYRSQLYWAPSVITGTDGKKQVDFYASDLPGRYAVVVNGLTAEGVAGSQTIYFTVAAQ